MRCEEALGSKDSTLDCGNAGTCIFYCDEAKCMESAVINARNTAQLRVIIQSNANECIKSANFLLPNNGNVIFTTEGAPKKPFKGLTLHDGTNTGDIEITIGSASTDDTDAMKDMTLNVPNANSLKITIDGAAEIDDSVIICPDYRPPMRYEGPLEAPCIIDIGTGGYFDEAKVGVEIISPNGFPKGVVFPSGYSGTGAWIDCSGRVDGLNGDQTYWNYLTNLTSSAACYWTNDPTKTPTIAPSKAQTTIPTTTRPSSSPTKNPTLYTIDVTNDPSNSPTTNPSAIPTRSGKTYEPSAFPSNIPSHFPASHPILSIDEKINSQTNVTETQDPYTSLAQQTEKPLKPDSDSSGSPSSALVVILVCTGIAFCIVLCIIGFIFHKRRINNKLENARKVVGHEDNVNDNKSEDIDYIENHDDIVGLIDLKRDQKELCITKPTPIDIDEEVNHNGNNVFISSMNLKMTPMGNDVVFDGPKSNNNANMEVDDDDDDDGEELYQKGIILQDDKTTSGPHRTTRKSRSEMSKDSDEIFDNDATAKDSKYYTV